MPSRSSVYRLPEDVRAKLDRRLRATGFGRLDEHTAWLKAQGYNISRTAIWKYGAALRRAGSPCEGLRAAADRAAAACARLELPASAHEVIHAAIIGR